MTDLRRILDDALHDPEIRPEVAERLGYYGYLYIDPRDEKPLYVGKGKGGRALSHLSEAAESRKCAQINALRTAGLKSRIDVLAHGLRDEETAFRIEAAVIELFGLDALTNEVRGWCSLQLGRIPFLNLRRTTLRSRDRHPCGAAHPDQSSLSAQRDVRRAAALRTVMAWEESAHRRSFQATSV